MAFNVEALLEKAIDAKSAVEVLQALQVMRREMREEQAKQAFEEALSAFQSECPVITKDKGVLTNAGKTAYKYAPIESIEVQIRPVEQKHGFNHTFDTDIASAQGWVIAKCHITHRFGHTRTSVAKFPLGTKTAIMSDTQQYAAALTFANRRVLCNAYGLILAGEDMDGRGKIKPQGPSTLRGDSDTRELAQELWKALPVAVAGRSANWSAAKQLMVDENILTPDEHGGDVHSPQLSPERFKEVIANVKEKLK